MSWVRCFSGFAAAVLLNSCVGFGGSGTREVVYTPAAWPAEVRGTVFRPHGARPAPAVLLIHGGVKLGNDGRWVMAGIARKLVARGYYVLNVTYRPIGGAPYPAQLRDVRAALGWMRENADEEGIDPDRIAVFGYSAGGYLGLLAATDGRVGDVGVRAVIAGATPTDLRVYENGDLLKRYFGITENPYPDEMTEASPITYVSEKTPPVFLYYGTEDDLVRPDHAEALARRLKRFRVPHEVFTIPGRGHVGAFFSSGEAVDEAILFLDLHVR